MKKKPGSPEPSKGNPKKIKILPILMLIVGVGFGIGGMMMKDILMPPQEPKVVYAERKPDEVGPLVEVGEITAILKGGGVVKTEINLEGVNKKSTDIIESRLIFVRDRVLQVLMSRSADDINSTEGQENLKVELLSQINEMCGDNVNKVLFSSFIFTR